MRSKILKAAIVQQPCVEDRATNLRMSEEGIRAAAAGGAQLVLLQELHTSLYFCQHESTALFDLAEPIPGPSTQWLGALAKELGLVVVGSLFERRAAGLYHNTAVVLDRDGAFAGWGYHRRIGGAHAEVEALKRAGAKARGGGARLAVARARWCWMERMAARAALRR